jgi:hypothetical protein
MPAYGRDGSNPLKNTENEKKKYIEQKSYLLCRSGVINPWLLTCGYQSVVTNLGLSTWGEGTQEVGWGGHVSRFYKFWKLCVL